MEPAWIGTQDTKWNIFARELEGVLKNHNLRLGHLDDRQIVVHPEKVRRLQKSLKTPSHFPVLNPEEMERLQQVIGLTEDENQRLRAALIATAAERTLMDRMDPETALMAADGVFEICLAAQLVFVKAGRATDDDDESDKEAWEALDLLDEATLALHGAHNAASLEAKRSQAHTALVAFERAIALLNAKGPRDKSDIEWQSRLDEAEEGRKQAEALLQR